MKLLRQPLQWLQLRRGAGAPHEKHAEHRSDSQTCRVSREWGLAGFCVIISRVRCHHRRGRRAGYAMSLEEKLKHETGVQKALRTKAQKQRDALAHAVLPDLANYTASAVFGVGADKGGRRKNEKQLMVEGVLIANPTASKANYDYVVAEARGVASHVRAQASGLHNMISLAPAQHVFSILQADDASMWTSTQGVERPRELIAANFNKFAKRLAKAYMTKGAAIHLPVLNSVEELCITRLLAEGGVSIPAAALIHSPARPMAIANAPTVSARLQEWAVVAPGGPGTKVDPGRVLAPALQRVAWKTMAYLGDNLPLNACLVKIFQNAHDLGDRHLLDSDGVDIFHSFCAAHSAVLPLKQLIEVGAKGTSSKLVRMAHLLQSGRTTRKYHAGLTQIADKFKYRVCERLPEAACGQNSGVLVSGK